MKNPAVRYVLVLGLVVLVLFFLPGVKFVEQPGLPPLQQIKLTKSGSRVKEITLTLQPQIQLSNVVNLSIFTGFTPFGSVADARRQHGEPEGVRPVTEMDGLKAYIYPVAQGEIGLLEVLTEFGIECQLWAFPTNHSPDAFLLDASLKSQLLPHLHPAESTRVNIQRDTSYGGVVLNMNRARISSLILTTHDTNSLPGEAVR